MSLHLVGSHNLRVLIVLAAAVILGALVFAHASSTSAATASAQLVVKTDAVPCPPSSTADYCVPNNGQAFLLGVDLVKAPAAGYIAVQTEIVYGSLVYKPAASADLETTWPDELSAFRSPGSPTGLEGTVNHAMPYADPGPITVISHYEGNLVEITIHCTGGASTGHVIELVPVGASNTDASALQVDANTVIPLSDSITIDCVGHFFPPTPVPPTPASVGGISFAPPSDGSGARGLVDITTLAVLATGAAALTAAAWYARRRLH